MSKAPSNNPGEDRPPEAATSPEAAAPREAAIAQAPASAKPRAAARAKPKVVASAKPRAAARGVRGKPADAAPAGEEQALELASSAMNHTLSATPLLGVRPGDLFSAAGSLFKAVGKTPIKAGLHVGSYLKELRDIVGGSSSVAPDPRDKRFADPAWQSNVLLRALMQGYLAGNRELSSFIDEANIGPLDKGRAQFILSLLVDALAPSNLLLTNPTALRKMVDTGGMNLVRGVQQFSHDLLNNRGMPSQVDSQPFKVGENVATAKGQVVFRNRMFELLQFAPTTETVHARPLVMSPPQINKYYAIDLSPDKSLIRWIQDSGVQLFVISWRNPTAKHRDWGLSEYALCLDQAVEVARQITGSADVNMWGSCSGGLTLAAYLGWLAARGEGAKVANTSWAVCVLDMPAALDDTTLGLFATPAALRAAKASSKRKGVLSGQELSRMFAWMRPNDLIWSYWVNNYLLGNKPPAFDILAWNNDTTRLPAKLHADYLDLVQHNPYSNPGQLRIGGESIDMGQVEVGAYVIGGTTDHITPWQGCYGTARLFGADSTFVLSNAGHLQSLVNPPGNPKSYFYAAPASASDPEDWLQGAGERVAGSWWPHWRQWIQQRSGASQTAPLSQGSSTYPPLCAAPGTYVLQR